MSENPYQSPSIPADASAVVDSPLLRRRQIAKQVSGGLLTLVALGFAMAAIYQLSQGVLNRALFFGVISVSSASVAIWLFAGTNWKTLGVIGLVVLVMALFFL